MGLDQRVRVTLREAGVPEETLRDAEAAAATAADVTAFFGALDAEGADTATVYSDMDLAHASAEHPEHEVRGVDLYTHSEAVRGWIRFAEWGAYVAGARVLSEDVVELELGPTVHDRVRFAADPEQL
jgi:hypothetical protein